MEPNPTTLTIIPLPGIPEVRAGDDLAALMDDAARREGLHWRDGDVAVVAQKVVSKAEGACVALHTVCPSPLARQWAAQWERDARVVELVLRESRRIVRMERGVIVAETRHGFVCANAGVDRSNTGAEGTAVLLPEAPDRSAALLREALRTRTGADVAVIVADTFGRPWRVGLAQVALGVAGLQPLADLRGTADSEGRELRATQIAVADELAAAADLVCGKTRRVPAAVVRGYAGPRGGGAGRDLLREAAHDLFR